MNRPVTPSDAVPDLRFAGEVEPRRTLWPKGPAAYTWGNFLRAYKTVLDRIEDDLRRETVVNLGEYEILHHLTRADGRLRFVDLARKTLLSESRIQRKMTSLQDRGLINREAAEDDRRSVLAVMTPAGAKAFEAAQPVFLDALHRHLLQHVPDDQIEQFNAILHAMWAPAEAEA